MQIAEIVPVSCLDHIKNKNYYMCLAPLVLKNEKYAEFYRQQAQNGKYVILDNGAAEGESLSFDDLYKAYKTVQPTEIILPDVLFKASETMARSNFFYEGYLQHEHCKVMIVPQARSLRSWIMAAEEMIRKIPADTIGIPKWLGSKNNFYRVAASAYLSELNTEVHLLGCSENPEVLRLCKKANPKVRGCDSAYAYLCSKAGMKEITPNTERPGGFIHFLDDPEIASLPKLMNDLEEIVK